MNRRARILGQWLRGRRNGTRPGEIARFLLSSTCARKARARITSVAEAGQHLVIRLRGADRALYWPREIDVYFLYMVIAEITDARDWHYYEVAETRVEPSDVVLDCGAAEGVFTLFTHSRAQRVYAIEPSPTWCRALEVTFAGAENTSVLPYALGRSAGEAYLADGVLDAHVSSAGGTKVRVETIDRLFYETDQRISYLKADLEGHELEMLAGAARTIGRDLPKIAITTYHDPSHADRIAGFLHDVDRRYQTRVKGIEPATGAPVMLHAWVA